MGEKDLRVNNYSIQCTVYTGDQGFNGTTLNRD